MSFQFLKLFTTRRTAKMLEPATPCNETTYPLEEINKPLLRICSVKLEPSPCAFTGTHKNKMLFDVTAFKKEIFWKAPEVNYLFF